ncbi:MAG: hypothetical protein EWV92_22160 [Microcystis aeruginosa Ma_MB_S_20031200_S102]|uniref:Uncharacterized protein n=1 Tax=Microcystis aeruginosa Ma_MB_S_20031200_S102 TaxID=2486254 RepID=A0A552E7P8_MICAE|nr:MAG: hypothetical protein EWV79_05735 [Microcystis aeruginosa Ma_MB_S_20031200_S102D]TRU30462.1 MAG: hypothetical protein EWV92_22160 [Microcystis aeruginosa Ma_MB_S_20031200_S102]
MSNTNKANYISTRTLQCSFSETFRITLSRVTIRVNFQHITPFRRNHPNFSLYHAQKPVSQISLLQTISFKETDHRSLLEI